MEGSTRSRPIANQRFHGSPIINTLSSITSPHVAVVVLPAAGPLRSRCSSARQYRTAEVESLRVIVDSEWVPRAAPGYWPIRFDITNLGDARVIEIVVQGTRFFRARPGWNEPRRRFARPCAWGRAIE